MITKSRAVVLNYTKFKDTSIIVKAYTEDFGMNSFMVNGIRSPKSKRSIGHFQPFSLLDLVYYFKPNRDIHRLSEWKSFHQTFQIQQSIYKGAIVMFLSEILGKLLTHEPDDNKSLFHFLENSIISLDQIDQGVENFHLHFLLKLIPHLGFGVVDGQELLRSMELENIHNKPETIDFISALLHSTLLDIIPASGQKRLDALEVILAYYNHHDLSVGEVKSLKVLHKVFG